MQSPVGFHEGYSVIFLVSFYSGLGINVCVLMPLRPLLVLSVLFYFIVFLYNMYAI